MIKNFINNFQLLFFVGVLFALSIYIYGSDSENLKRYGKETIGDIYGVEAARSGRANLFINYTVKGKAYMKSVDYYDNKFITIFQKCLEDNSCIGKRYIVRYLPDNPEIAIVCFDKPLPN